MQRKMGNKIANGKVKKKLKNAKALATFQHDCHEERKMIKKTVKNINTPYNSRVEESNSEEV